MQPLVNKKFAGRLGKQKTSGKVKTRPFRRRRRVRETLGDGCPAAAAFGAVEARRRAEWEHRGAMC